MKKRVRAYAFALTKRHDRHRHFRGHGKRRLSVAGHPSLYQLGQQQRQPWQNL